MSESSKDRGLWVDELNEAEDKATKSSQWGLVGTKLYKGFSATHKKLPTGVYTITLDRHDNLPLFKKNDVKTDEVILLKDKLTNKVLKEISLFWTRKQYFVDMGFLHRRGYLFYGQQGIGKTCLVQQMIQKTKEREGIIFICENPEFFNQGLKVFRQTEPERELLCIFEDIDAIIDRYQETDVLSVLDGTNMVDGVLNVATTNYPEKLDKRIISRPRRFDRVIKIIPPTEKVRLEFLKKKLPKEADFSLWVKETKGLSFAGLTEAIISVFCLGNKLEDTVKVLANVEKGHPSSGDFGDKEEVGFCDNSDEEPPSVL